MSIDPYQIIKYPVPGEKSIRMMELHNKLVFVVGQSASKPAIKEAIQKLFNAKVDSVHTKISPGGVKQAVVKFGKETRAIDVATSLGLI